MIKIRKRSNPQAETIPNNKILCGILRRTTSSDSLRKPYRTVAFVDEIGKPLVDYRYLPPKGDDSQNPSGHAHHHQKTSGKYMHNDRVETLPKWKLIGVKGARKPRGQSEMGKIEEQRLDRLGISRAPLFGTFETIESINLIPDAILRARAPVPRIPLTDPSLDPQISYEQVFEQPPKPSFNVINLMAQLKQRGLISNEQTEDQQQKKVEKPQKKSRWNQQNTPKIDKACKFFINNPGGCSHGEKCRFQHNEEERTQRQLELQQIELLEKSSKSSAKKPENSWRRPPYHRHRTDEKRRENRRKSRSRSPKRRD